jgi:hypothetical protein
VGRTGPTGPTGHTGCGKTNGLWANAQACPGAMYMYYIVMYLLPGTPCVFAHKLTCQFHSFSRTRDPLSSNKSSGLAAEHRRYTQQQIPKISLNADELQTVTRRGVEYKWMVAKS